MCVCVCVCVCAGTHLEVCAPHAGSTCCTAEMVYTRVCVCAGTHLEVCAPHAGSTCCTAEMEQELVAQGRRQVNSIIANKINVTRQNFVTRTKKYNGNAIRYRNLEITG